MRNDFAVFILTHGRADRVITVNTLRRCGYTGKIYLIIDDQDNDEDEYYKRYGDSVIKFCKEDAAKESDVMDSDTDMRIVLYARNQCHRIAKELGLTYFLELDDDYNEFRFRVQDGTTLTSVHMKHLDKVFDAMLDFLEVSGAVTVAFAQSGDFIGGIGSNVWRKQLARKAMNAFFCRTDRPFRFVGRVNEDVNTYTSLAHKGYLFFTLSDLNVNQGETQQNSGGMTETYKQEGTYIKSFYTVMVCPSAVKISTLSGGAATRIHHKINWNRCAPKILRQEHKHV